MRNITQLRSGSRSFAWAAGCVLLVALVAPAPAAGQATLRPAERPVVTAENEPWFLEGQPLTFSGSVYFPAGAAVFFNANEMVRSGNYRGIPLYSMVTRDPYGVVYVPAAGGLMQPYERRRDGDVAGTVGASAPSFPVGRDSQALLPDAGLQAAGPPAITEVRAAPAVELSAPTSVSTPAPSPGTAAGVNAGTVGTSGAITRPLGPLTSALRPTGLNAFYIQFNGQRYYSTGPAIALEQSGLTRTGDYHGFPVYVSANNPGTTIYVPVANAAGGLVAPYSTRK
jgi:hypothetical protein